MKELLKRPAAGASPQAPRPGAVRCVHPPGARLGEGVLWSAREQALYWVDILACRLHRLQPTTGDRQSWLFAEEISALAERATAAGLIVTLRRGFALFDPASDSEPR